MSAKIRGLMSAKIRPHVGKDSGLCRQRFGLGYSLHLLCLIAPIVQLKQYLYSRNAAAFGLLLIAFNIANYNLIVQHLKHKISVFHCSVPALLGQPYIRK